MSIQCPGCGLETTCLCEPKPIRWEDDENHACMNVEALRQEFREHLYDELPPDDYQVSENARQRMQDEAKVDLDAFLGGSIEEQNGLEWLSMNSCINCGCRHNTLIQCPAHSYAEAETKGWNAAIDAALELAEGSFCEEHIRDLKRIV